MFMRHVIAVACLIAFGAFPPAAGAQSDALPIPFASPAPSFDHPRKIVLSLSERDPARVNEVLSNIGNVQKFYGADNVQIVLIAYGPGIHALLRNDSTVKPRIASLIAIGIAVFACDATLQTLHLGAAALLPGVRIVPNGIPAIVEFEAAGWYYVRP
jgi:intracellular sulfur oxidation DsrE/DsrF family protein